MTQIFRTARAFALPLSLAASLTVLAGCSGSGDDIARSVGLVRDAPDEFVVTTRAPLTLPPDLNALPVPTPGVARPQERSARDAAQLTLAPQSVTSNSNNAPASAGEKALLNASGPKPAPGIRADVDRTAKEDADDSSILDRVKFWKDKPVPGLVVDAPKEAQRIRQNAALGRSPVDGPTPMAAQKTNFDLMFTNPNPPENATPLAPAAPEQTPAKHWWNIF